jgi:hypothetical protein
VEQETHHQLVLHKEIQVEKDLILLIEQVEEAEQLLLDQMVVLNLQEDQEEQEQQI